ncbi:MAG: D-alanyl-D-alanine carboxypeptidase [Clostridiales bacterium]|nr:D-alanyl-D-alanine carboxypeptidase [Clostridiales bacterium]
MRRFFVAGKEQSRVARICMLVTLLMFLLAPTEKNVRGEPTAGPGQLYAESAVLMDGDSGRILYDKQGDQVMPMASTTKIMTCILALETQDLSQKCTVSAYAASMPEVSLGVREGEQYILEDLLYAMMLESDNDVAVVVAEAVAGSVEEFAAKMNEKAKALQCKDTHFVTPNGLDGQDEEGAHSTTARDLAKIMRYCIQNEDFCRITGTDSWDFTDCSSQRSFHCDNHNAFLYQMEGAFSGKTGFTGAAGYCYIGAFRRDGKTFLAAILAAGWPPHKEYKWSDMRKLMEYGLENYDFCEISSEDIILEEMPVTGGREEYVHLRTVPEEGSILVGEQEEVEWEIKMLDQIQAPVCEGMTVGYAMLKLDGMVVRITPVVTDGNVDEKTGFWLRIRSLF